VSIDGTDTVLLRDRLLPGRMLPNVNRVSLGWRFRRGFMPVGEPRNADGGDEPKRADFSCIVRDSSLGIDGMGGGDCGVSSVARVRRSLKHRLCLRVVIDGCMNCTSEMPHPRSLSIDGMMCEKESRCCCSD